MRGMLRRAARKAFLILVALFWLEEGMGDGMAQGRVRDLIDGDVPGQTCFLYSGVCPLSLSLRVR